MQGKELCEVCKKAKHSLLCDYRIGTGIVTSIDFQELTETCDKKMCRNCTVRLWPDCDVCPEHADIVRERLAKEADAS